MKEYDLNNLLNDSHIVKEKIDDFLKEKILKKQKIEKEEIKGHMLKSEHNLRFVKENMRLGFLDWAVAGCYYACYHAALSLILTKGFSSKNHLATLCVLIDNFYKKELSKEDIETISEFIDYHDLLFYVESKNKREKATYSTKTGFDGKEAEKLRVKAALFVSKMRSIIENAI